MKRFIYASAVLVLIASLAVLQNRGCGADACRHVCNEPRRINIARC